MPRWTRSAPRRASGARSRVVTYSPKVFIPLTKLCRDVCHYCTFARPPRRGERAYLREDEVLAIAREGAAAGCHEALFTLGDKPELRYRAAREELAALGCETTLEYLARCAKLVLDETGLLPHLNPGVMTRADLAALRKVSVSQGIMLETASDRLSRRGGPHFGSPDKLPAARLATIDAAGAERVPFTTGILIGIGETRAERIEALLAIRELHERHGHVQEVIVQNFRAKPGTRMADAPEPSLDELLWSAAVARLVLPPEVHVQAPPNLSYDDFPRLLDAGIDDWGGISPVTIDHVNPEAPWPEVERLERGDARRRARAGAAAGGLPGVPGRRVGRPGRAPRCAQARRRRRPRPRGPLGGRGSDRDSLRAARRPPGRQPRRAGRGGDRPALLGARGGAPPGSAQPPTRCGARSAATRSPTSSRGTSTTPTSATSAAVSARSRRASSPRTCAGSRTSCRSRRSRAVRRRPGSAAPWRSACRAGSIPAFTGDTYLEICEAVKAAVPGMHVHAFSALEVWQGAATLGLDLTSTSARLRDAGLASLPGTAAEILDDEVRAVICPDKVTTAQWLSVHDAAHRVGPALDDDDHVRPRRGAALVGPPPDRAARAAAAKRRLHRVRAAAVRAHGGADLPARRARGRARPSARRC